jgi:predicted ATPase
MNHISHLAIQGFRSIKDADIPLRPLNILIGANGAGKSNLIDFFRMMNDSMTRGLQDPYLRERGPASAILHFGPKTTGVIRAEVVFNMDGGTNTYRFTLADSAGDRLTYTKEDVQFQRDGSPQSMPAVSLISHPSDNSGLCELWADNDPAARFAKKFLSRCRVFQFHDTSVTSHLRDYAPADQSRYLCADGGNLSAVLFDLREQIPEDYGSIVRMIQAVLPWFGDFVLEPEGNKGVLLRWKMKGRADYLFGPGQLSDGSLRIMALITLLSLPPQRLPNLIILDEPELGLHPAAEAVIAGLIKSAALDTQVLVSTQSASFIDQFSADDIIVVENENGESRFEPQTSEKLFPWLEQYTLSQVWGKNLIGGRP